MARTDGSVRNARQVRQTANPPAWLGKTLKGQAGAALGQNQNAAAAVPGFQEPMSNTGRTSRWDQEDYGGGPRITMRNMLPGGGGAPTITEFRPPSFGPRLPAYGGKYDPFKEENLPYWLQRSIDINENPLPAYGGSYNPTNMVTQAGQWNVPAWLGGDAETRDIREVAGAVPPVPPMPVYPISQTHPYGGVPIMPPMPESSGVSPFSTTYSGNWRRYGGGGGGGYYGGGGYGPPAWLPNMGLYSLKWGG